MHLRRRKNARGKLLPAWYAIFKDRAGRWCCKSTHRTDKAAAHEVGLRYERDALRDPADAAAAAATLHDALRLFGAHCERQQAAGAITRVTLDYYAEKAGHFVRLWGEGQRLAELSTRRVREYLTARVTEGASATTAAKEVDVLLMALKIAREHELFAGDPRALKPAGISASSTPRTGWRTLEEVRAILQALRGVPWRAAAVAFSAATGAEVSAIFAARRGDIELYTKARAGVLGMVHVRGSKNAARDRQVPVVLPYAAQLLRYALSNGDGDGDGQLFRPWPNINRDLPAACRRAKVPRTTPHDLRRTYAHLHYQAGITLDVLAPAMGHKDTTMLSRIYAKPTPDELAKKMASQTAKPRRG